MDTGKVAKVLWEAREQRSCTSHYWQTAFPHLQVRQHMCKIVDDSCLLQRSDRKRKANMTLNIHLHQHLTGPAIMAGVHAEI